MNKLKAQRVYLHWSNSWPIGLVWLLKQDGKTLSLKGVLWLVTTSDYLICLINPFNSIPICPKFYFKVNFFLKVINSGEKPTDNRQRHFGLLVWMSQSEIILLFSNDSYSIVKDTQWASTHVMSEFVAQQGSEMCMDMIRWWVPCRQWWCHVLLCVLRMAGVPGWVHKITWYNSGRNLKGTSWCLDL